MLRFENDSILSQDPQNLIREMLSHVFDLTVRAGTRQSKPSWPASIQTAVDEGSVIAGMTREQVLVAWGSPAWVVSQPGYNEIWSFHRGTSLLEQLRNSTHVTFSDGLVLDVGGGTSTRLRSLG